ncbi:hypothetical protein [Salinibacter sp.]|uniref:hypothetical protein n=1 Tax=Salinibacter sp. TaxID=2065818 RepID=UPI0021E76CB3|nr:hypothetical protein [Salinibacter sp.]
MTHNGTGEVTRRKGVGKHARGGALESWGGIVSGRVTDYAEAIGTSPEAVLRAAEEVELVFDTAKPKGRGKDRDRPTDPALRCLAMTAESARRLVETARSNGPEPAHA